MVSVDDPGDQKLRAEVDPGARGLSEHKEDGPGMCTECLGCESCEMGMDDADVAAAVECGDIYMNKPASAASYKVKEKSSFPPPLPWLSGGRSKFLKGERRDGRLVLTEFTMDSPKVFCASRKDGRLRLDMVADTDTDTDTEEEVAETVIAVEEEGERRRVEWGRSEGLWRCQEMMNNEAMRAWCHHRFVTTA